MNTIVLLSWLVLFIFIACAILELQPFIHKINRGNKSIVLLSYNTAYGRKYIILFEFEDKEQLQ